MGVLDTGNGPALAELLLDALELETELTELALDEELELDVELESDDSELETELEELFGSAGTGVSSCLLHPDSSAIASNKHGGKNLIAARCEPTILQSSSIVNISFVRKVSNQTIRATMTPPCSPGP